MIEMLITEYPYKLYVDIFYIEQELMNRRFGIYILHDASKNH